MKKLLIVAVIFAFIAVSASAQVPAKPFTVYASAGLSVPMASDFKDAYKMGYHGNAQLGFNSFPKGEVLINLDYHTFSPDWGDAAGFDGGTLSAILAGADVKLNLGVPAAPMSPFIFGGGGLAVLSWSDITTPLGSGPVESQNKFYFEVGGGVTFTQFFVKVKYVSISTDGSSIGFAPVSVGMKF